VLPSSHSWPSPPSETGSLSWGRRIPSPHAEVHSPGPSGQTGSRRQKAVQPRPPWLLSSAPRSHCSEPSTTTSPHEVRSQGSPGVGQTQPSPESSGCGSTLQSLEHPSPLLVFPSSHSSLPARKPSPHSAAIHGTLSVGHAHPSSSLQSGV